MTFSNTDSENLARVAKALERMAAADERRNELLVADAKERRESWAAHEARQAEAIERIAGPREDPWRDAARRG